MAWVSKSTTFSLTLSYLIVEFTQDKKNGSDQGEYAIKVNARFRTDRIFTYRQSVNLVIDTRACSSVGSSARFAS